MHRSVCVDVDNRDDARTNQAYVAMVLGEAEQLFAEKGFYVKLSHRCDIHQAVQLSALRIPMWAHMEQSGRIQDR